MTYILKTLFTSLLLLTLLAPISFAQQDALKKAPTQEKLAQNSRQNAASGSYIDIIPAPSVKNNKFPTSFNEPTHPPITLSPDKSELIQLDEPVTTIIAGNPAHLTIIPSTAQGIILIGRQPGATHFIALNDKNQVVMQRHVFVAAPKKDYVRIRKNCAALEDPEGCATTQIYYCPEGMCHNITIPMPAEEKGDAGEAENDAAASGQDIQNAMPNNASPE